MYSAPLRAKAAFQNEALARNPTQIRSDWRKAGDGKPTQCGYAGSSLAAGQGNVRTERTGLGNDAAFAPALTIWL